MQLFQAFTKIILLISLSVWLSACGGGGSSDVPTDTSLVFSVFPPGYFDGSYSDLYSLTGSSSDDENFNATLREQSGSDVCGGVGYSQGHTLLQNRDPKVLVEAGRVGTSFFLDGVTVK